LPYKKNNADLKQTREAILPERRKKPDTSNVVK
jgi:hypothetical protein